MPESRKPRPARKASKVALLDRLAEIEARIQLLNPNSIDYAHMERKLVDLANRIMRLEVEVHRGHP